MKTIATALAACCSLFFLPSGSGGPAFADPQETASPIVIPRGDGGITVNVSPEAAAELKAALRKPSKAKEAEPESPPPEIEPVEFDYDVEIYKAKQSGTSQDVRILTLCRDTPTGGVKSIHLSI